MVKSKTPKNIINTTLQKLGLSEQESSLYLLMFKYPQTTVQQLSVWAPYPRTLIYHILKQLSEKGLIITQKSKWKTLYTAEDPGKLYDILNFREKEFEKEGQSIREMIPQLKHRHSLSNTKLSIRIFNGIEEYERVLNDSLQSKITEIYSFEKIRKDKPGKETRESFERRRVFKKIKKNVLFFEDNSSLDLLSKIKYNDYTNWRGIQEKNLIPFETDVFLYENKILYTNYNNQYEPVAVLIEDKNLYQMHKNIFDFLWKNAKNRTLYNIENK